MSSDNYMRTIVAGIVIFFIGFVVLMVGNSIKIPSGYLTFLGVPYAQNGNPFTGNMISKAITMILGYLMLAYGSASAIYTYLKHDLSDHFRNVSQMPPQQPIQHMHIPSDLSVMQCFSCGAENAADAVFCNKCGRKLACD